MPQQRKKEESERLSGERDQIKCIDLGFERWQVVRFRKVLSVDTTKCLTDVHKNANAGPLLCLKNGAVVVLRPLTQIRFYSLCQLISLSSSLGKCMGGKYTVL